MYHYTYMQEKFRLAKLEYRIYHDLYEDITPYQKITWTMHSVPTESETPIASPTPNIEATKP